MTAVVAPNDPSTGELRRGRLLVLAAALMWSTSGLFLKSPPLAALAGDFSGPLIACFRALIAGALLAPLVRWKRARFRPALIPMMLTFSAMNVLFITSMTLTTAAAAIFLQYTGIVWAAVLGTMVLGERLDRGGVVAAGCALVGICWIVASAGSGQMAGTLIGLASGLSYGGVVLALRYLREEDSSWLVLLNLSASGLVLLPWVLPLRMSLSGSQWALIVLLGVFQMGVPYLLFAGGVRYLRSQEESLLCLIEPVLNPLWVWLAWGERVESAVLAGGACILLGLGLRYTLFARPPVPVRVAYRAAPGETSPAGEPAGTSD